MKFQTIQVSRGLAALVISTSHAIEVLNHYGFPGLNFLKHRTGGVDFFFTLSGFVIFYVFSKKDNHANFAKYFLIKRLSKIYPLVWFFTLLSLPVYFFIPEIGAGNEMQLSVIINSLFLIPQAVEPVLGATWSLSHVVLFYIFFYFYVLKPKFISIVLIIWLLLFFNRIVFYGFAHEENFLGVLKNFVFNPFNLEFIFGALLAKYVLNKKKEFGLGVVFIGPCIFVIGWNFIDANSHPLMAVLIYCVASLFTILGSTEIDKKFIFEVPKSISILGDSSYAIIVVNLPIIVAFSFLLHKLVDTNYLPIWFSVFAVFCCVVFSAVGGIFSYKFIDPLVSKLLKKFMTVIFQNLNLKLKKAV